MSDVLENENGRIGEIDAPAGAREKTAGFDADVVENAEIGIPETPSFQDASLLDEYEQAGHGAKLIRLRGKEPVGRWKDLPSIGVDGGKRWMAKGGNVGFRMSNTDLVIDIDPRRFPDSDDVLARFLRDFDLPAHPFVLTGGGGYHLYFRKPAEDIVRYEHDNYPGFEFRTSGHYVVSAGSVHPDTGRLYRFDDDPLRCSLSEAPMMPDRLLDAIRKPNIEASSDEAGALDPETLAEWLVDVDPTEFKDQRKWQDMMMACHHATNGTGVDEFIVWSTSDPEYSDYSEVIRQRWDPLEAIPDGITVRTLIGYLPREKRREAVELINRTNALDDFPDDLDAEPDKTRSVWDDWVFVADAMQFVRREDGKKYRTDQWKALYAGLNPDGEVLNAIWKGRVPMRKFESLVYLPETGEFPDGESGRRYNIWRKDGVEAKAGDVTPFLVHLAYLFPDGKDRDHVLDYLALLVQRPADKIHFALLIRGAQGTGKSWIGRLMERIVGSRNTVRPSNEEVVSHWTAWMEGAQLAVIEELMTLGRKEVANRLKPAITDPTIRIEEKNCSLYSIPNCLNFIGFTNHEDALPIEHGDRRWLVVFSPARPRDSAYYQGLFEFLDGDGAAYVKHWLLKRKVGLNPHGVAPFTAGKEAMRRLSIGDAEAYLLELFEERQPPFDFDLVRVDELVDAVPSALRGRSNLRARVSKFLKDEIGAVSHARYTKADRQRPAYQLWSVRNHDIWDNIGASGRIDAYLSHRSDDVLDQFKR
ncbi:hypothetical protein Nham_2527 [Nitrobacter hamburgensis X14]|uniref:DNA primase/polymerase bifunctional N-terminal domain-containing protein n=1 Tax=Nitrobacter hamburgensis (strain DSM 10229 / NCIMB 13809 / X14) TaxID=323097 RepID=Q1QKD8_NITHX|nr:DUF5906 domain-containing protein [Nitrobacter hamburgensis]ABE63309.1 hypothetical protein Nham_2527 [Nitrobacter hamburgensis X14]